MKANMLAEKGGHTINVQGVALPDGSFSHVVAKYPGSAHDARIYRESLLYTELVVGTKSGLLLGDSAYPLSRFLLKPLPAPATARDRRYQKALLSTRATVECAFGQLKGRWNCLHQELRYTPERCCTIISACFALHNFAIARRLPRIPLPDRGPPEDDDMIAVDDITDMYVRDGRTRESSRLWMNFLLCVHEFIRLLNSFEAESEVKQLLS